MVGVQRTLPVTEGQYRYQYCYGALFLSRHVNTGRNGTRADSRAYVSRISRSESTGQSRRTTGGTDTE